MIMINLLLSYLKLYQFSSQRISICLVNKDFQLINSGLKRYDIKVRRAILNQLKHVKIKDSFLIKTLYKIVETDFLTNASVALQILKKHPEYLSKYKLKKLEKSYNNRLIAKQNRSAFYQDYKYKTSGKMIDKSKMEQLELVKQQLKRSIRLY